MGINKAQEREYARILYVNERITFKEIAERTGVTEKTISKWAEADNWSKLRKSLLTTKENQLVHWYNQLDAMNEHIAKRDLPVPDSKESDIMSKTTSNIKNLETETGIGEYVEVGRKLLTYVQSIDLDDAKKFKNYIDGFINSKLKNG
jgi:uncharacterized protein YjcR